MNRRYTITALVGLTLLLTACSRGPEKPVQLWQFNQMGMCIVDMTTLNDSQFRTNGWVTDTSDSIHPAVVYKGAGNMATRPLPHDAPSTMGANRLTVHVWTPRTEYFMVQFFNNPLQKDDPLRGWVRVNNSLFQPIYELESNMWSWTAGVGDTTGYQTFRLEKGLNTIEIAGRQTDWQLQRLLIMQEDVPRTAWGRATALPQTQVEPAKIDDQERPTPPDSLRARKIDHSFVDLQWQAAADDQRVLTYDIYRDDEHVGATSQTHFMVGGLDPDQDYTFTVRSRDVVGKRSKPSKPLQVKTIHYNKKLGVVFDSADEEPVLDGLMDEVWLDQNNYTIALPILGRPDGGLDLTAYGKWMWDMEYLYLYVKVVDDTILPEAGEGFDLWLDLDNSKSKSYSINDRFYTVEWPAKITEHFNPEVSLEGVELRRTEWEMDTKWGLQEGYIFEIALPWSALGIEPREDQLIGAEIRLRDYDTDVDRPDTVLGWFNGNYDNGGAPMLLGTVILTKDFI